MANNRAKTLRQIAKLEQAYTQLARAARNQHGAEANADRRLNQLLDMLDAGWASNIDDLIRNARQKVVEERRQLEQDFAAQSDTLVAAEVPLIRETGATQHHIQALYKTYRALCSESDKFLRSSQELREKLTQLHRAVKAHLIQCRALPRKSKKNAKKKIAQGVTSFVFGTGMIFANTQLPHLGLFSYAIGAAALHQALRDFVGKAADS